MYAQWVASVIAYSVLEDHALNIGTINVIFQAANFVGLLYITGSKGHNLYAAEAYIVLLLCSLGIFPGVILTADKSKPQARPYASNVGAPLQLLLMTAIAYYGLWFVYTGLDKMQTAPAGAFVFVFARVVSFLLFRILCSSTRVLSQSLFHRFRTFLQFLFIVAAGYATYCIVRIPFDFFSPQEPDIKTPETLKERWAEAVEAPFRSHKRAPSIYILGGAPLGTFLESFFPGFDYRLHFPDHIYEIGNYEIAAAVFSILVFGFFILSIELAIVWNHITKVNAFLNTGQLVPFVIGLANLGTILWAVLMCAHPPSLQIRPLLTPNSSTTEGEFKSSFSKSNGSRFEPGGPDDQTTLLSLIVQRFTFISQEPAVAVILQESTVAVIPPESTLISQPHQRFPWFRPSEFRNYLTTWKSHTGETSTNRLSWFRPSEFLNYITTWNHTGETSTNHLPPSVTDISQESTDISQPHQPSPTNRLPWFGPSWHLNDENHVATWNPTGETLGLQRKKFNTNTKN